MVIQNTLFWKNPELEEIWPQVWGRRHRHPGDGRRGRRGGPRDDSPESREPGHEESA
jgi:hypothetical protein